MDTEREIILLSVGSASVEDPDQLACLKNAHALIPNAALVVLSDREDSKEICAAFEAGATGFLPTNIEPSIALQALSFIRSGGSFFPLPPCRIAIRDPKGLRLHKRPPTAWIIATLRLVSWWTVSAASHQNRTTSSSSCAKDKQTS